MAFLGRWLWRIIVLLAWVWLLAIIGAWVYQPVWWGAGLAGTHEFEIQSADGAITLLASDGRSIGDVTHAKPDHFYAFAHHNSEWPDPPMIQDWPNVQRVLYDRYWYGAGDATDGSTASWIGMEDQLAVAWAAVPAIFLLLLSAIARRVRMRRQRRAQLAANAAADDKRNTPLIYVRPPDAQT